jgi:hypothetical protein
MSATFALWDLDTGNLVGAYQTEAAALAAVRHSIERHGRPSVRGLALARETSRSVRSIAQGDSLAERALGEVGMAAPASRDGAAGATLGGRKKPIRV